MPKLTKIIEHLLYFFVFLLPWQTRLIYQEFFINGQPFEYGRLSLYATEILLGLIMVLTLFVFVRKLKSQELKKNIATTKRRIILLSFGLVLVGLNTIFAISPTIAYYKLTQLILAVCLFLLLISTTINFQRLSWTYIYAALIQSSLALYQFTEQKVLENKWLGMSAQDPNILGTPVVLTSAGRWLRSFGSFPHPNMLAAFLIIALMLIVFLSLKFEDKKNKNKLILSFVFIFLALLTTLSKAALLGFVLFFLLALVKYRQKSHEYKKITRFAVLVLVVSAFFTVSYPELILKRTPNANPIEQRSYSERLNQYPEWSNIIRSNLFLGSGLGNYPLALKSSKPELESWAYQPIHNTFLLILAETGLVLAFFVLLLIYTYRKNFKKHLTMYSLPIITVFFMMLFDHFWWSFYSGLMLVAVTLALTILLNRDEQNN